MTAPPHRETHHVPVDPDLEYESIEVWPDEIKLGDIYGGYIVTGVSTADHYRAPAVRLTIFTDPELIPEGTSPEEFGRFVLRTDRKTGHRVPVERPVIDGGDRRHGD